MLGSVYGYTRCPECGISVPTTQLASGAHVCDQGQFEAHQAVLVRQELEGFSVPCEWENQTTAFLRWLGR